MFRSIYVLSSRFWSSENWTKKISKMLEKQEVKITEDEAILYDRQIRLWGLDAQKRLRSSRILISGLRGLGCEVAKNLVLAGVKSLKMIDNENLNEDDFGSNFLAPPEKVGSNRAEACIERLRQLNPMVEVSAESGNIVEKPESFFEDFDIVLVTGQAKDDLEKLNEHCRKHNVKFFAGDTIGFFGFTFMDLVEHEFVEEVKVNAESNMAEDDEPQAKKAKVNEEETKMVKNSVKFNTLAQALKVDWSQTSYAKRVKRMDPSFFLLHILFEFQSREGRLPGKDTMANDAKLLTEIKSSIVSKFNLPEGKVPDDLIDVLFAGEVSPVAAIVGGMLAQEIIKIISNKEAPNANFFLFNPMESAGIVELVA